MGDLIKLPVSDHWICSVDVVRTPDGRTVARLTDLRSSEISLDEQPRHAMLRFAKLVRDAADGMEDEALKIGDADD
ncbi:hypothetical protein [Methylobacterium pseudosasicola]|uniref:Uncharacterized protein n=1 Tax=Methylobacterium pseudosasicola TaxID=582667 RepID=A0A1I4U0Q2_9HYPH|nr:hypothetical protein [Methylobacterium pseudosasicola]SFM82421.1 hypothetical protein SAMN05192568_106115 [Methylobacterium pseudosasicola]